MLADLSPEELVDVADLRYVSDVLSRSEAIDQLQQVQPGKQQRIAELQQHGYPCYTTSASWLGYSDDRLRRLCHQAVEDGYRHVKLKVGADLDDDKRRCRIAREVIGLDRKLMIDANQIWEVNEAVRWVKALEEFDLWWIEEPTSPDDILGHAAVRNAVAPVKVATGEHCHNRVMFKQLLQARATDICQVDAARLASVNEVLTVMMMAAKFDTPVCPHAGGVGLCEMAQHISTVDYIAISAKLEGRVTEYVDHLQEQFVDPPIVKDAAYVLPCRPGFSTEMHESALETYGFPNGRYWIQANP
jgi:L-fuconate dehydratase